MRGGPWDFPYDTTIICPETGNPSLCYSVQQRLEAWTGMIRLA